MPINYSIVESSIPNVSGMIARVPRGNRISLNEIADSMAARTGISRVITQSVLKGLEDEVVSILCRGDNPDIGLGIFSVSLGGTFDSPMAIITPANAELHLSLNVSPQLRERIKAGVTFQKVSAIARVPSIDSIYDLNLVNVGVFTPGGIIRIIGDNLEFNEKVGTEGVFLTVGEDTFRITNYGRKGNKTIDFVVTKEAFVANQVTSITSPGVYVTVKSTYGSQTLRESSGQLMCRASFGGSVLLTGFLGVTGEALIRAIRDDVGPGVKLAYKEQGKNAFGTAQAISGTEDANYTLPGNEPESNSLIVTVKGPAFYRFIEESEIANGESLNLSVDIF